jgi:parvulin-like peptidyl-prolyl isomerase
MRAVRLWLGLVAVASIALTGCSKHEDLKLAEFKDRAIRMAEYEDAYAHVDPVFLPQATGEEGKLEFLNTMLNREVMAYKADELGYDKDPAVTQGMEGYKRMTLQVAFLQKEVGDKIEVTDADVKKHFDLMGTTLNVKQILCDTPDQAAAAYDELEKGTDFESVAREYSKQQDAAEGGMVVTVTYGTLIPEMQGPLFDLPVGGYTEPILTAHGWVIVKVLKIDKVNKPVKFEEIKDKLVDDVRRQKQTVATNKYTDKLREEAGVVWHMDNMEIIFNALPEDRPFEEAPPRNQEVYPLLFLEAGDLDKPLVSTNQRTITIKDFSDLYDQASFFNRPRKELRLGGIRGFLMLNIMNDISYEAVKKSGIENDPDVKKILQRKSEEISVNLLYEDMINKQTVITRDMMTNYYNDNIEQFNVPEKRKFGLVLAGDIETAQQAQEELRGGKPVAIVAKAYSIDEDTRATDGLTKEVSRGDNPEYDAVGFGLTRVGQVTEPFQTAKGWLVLKLVEMSPARVFTLEEAEGRVEAALRERENDRRLKELLAKWKEELGVVIHHDNLAKAKITERSPEEEKPKGHAGHRH